MVVTSSKNIRQIFSFSIVTTVFVFIVASREATHLSCISHNFSS